jgi:hypothetical protein
LKKEAFLTFSPSTLNSGFNIFPYRGDVLASVQGVLPELLKSLPVFPLMRPELNLLRAGYSELSEIHVTADFSFPSRQKLMVLAPVEF